MPHYRITIKLENENVQEFIIDDPRKAIDLVYLDYRKRVYQKNGAGRVTYFDLVMVAEESVKHQEDRNDVFKQENNSRKTDSSIPKRRVQRSRNFEPKMNLEEIAKYNSKLK